MDSAPLKAVADWMKTADLAEVSYRKNGVGFSLTAAGAGDPPSLSAPPMPAGRFSPVASDAVGVFQWSEPGKPRRTEEGVELAAGDVIGVVVAGSGAAKPLVAAHGGRVAKIFVEAGDAVEYGQPILLLEGR